MVVTDGLEGSATPENVQPIVLDIQVLILAAIDACKGKPVGSGDLLVLLSIIINVCVYDCRICSR
jgi:hypothetical protein